METIFYNTRQKLERLIKNSEKIPKNKRNNTNKVLIISLLSVSMIVLYFLKFRPPAIVALLVLSYFINAFFNSFKKINILKKALNFFKKGNDIKAFKLLRRIYKKTNDKNLLEIILEYFKEKGEPEEGEKIIISQEYKIFRKKDKKLDQIYKNINKTFDYIKKCRQNIEKFEAKKNELRELLSEENNQNLRQGYLNAISSYKEMYSLETNKLQFYENSKKELYKIKDYHIGQVKLNELTNELEQAEQEYFKNSFVENSITAEDIYNSIENEKSYIEALDYYGEDILNSTNFKMFEELQKEFEEKIKMIR